MRSKCSSFIQYYKSFNNDEDEDDVDTKKPTAKKGQAKSGAKGGDDDDDEVAPIESTTLIGSEAGKILQATALLRKEEDTLKTHSKLEASPKEE